MEYAESVTEILESWDVRAQQWYPVEGTLRFPKCGRSFPLVSISGEAGCQLEDEDMPGHVYEV
jgi:hypothetical protein